MQLSMAHGTYSPLIECSLRRALRPGDVFFDVGAHAGYFSALACSIVRKQSSNIQPGRVIAFDPNPDRASSLGHLQAACADVFRFFGLGASDSENMLCFERDPHNSGMSRVVKSQIASTSAIKVSVARLDDLIKQFDLPLPDVIKMDVEGHELQALTGAEATIQKSALTRNVAPPQ